MASSLEPITKQTTSVTRARSHRLRQMGKILMRDKFLYVLALPGLLYFLIFKYVPMWGIIISFQNYSPYQGVLASPWVGLEHFRRFFSNPDFFMLFRNTLAINTLSLIFFFPLPILLSLMLNEVRQQAYKKIVQSIVYLPHFLSWVIIVGITFILFSTGDGAVNQMLVSLGFEKIDFLTNKNYFWAMPYGALIFYLDQSKLVQMVEGMSVDNEGASFLMGKDGSLLVSPSSLNRKNAELELSVQESVMQRKEKTGSYLFQWKDKSYLISYGEYSRLGEPWRYVTTMQLSQLTAPIVIISRIILGMGAVGLIVACLLSWMASHRLYRPIRRLVRLVKMQKPDPGPEVGDELDYIANQWTHLSEERKALETKLKQAYPSLRAAFMMQLVQGHVYSLKEPEIRARLQTFGWSSESQWFGLMLARVTGVSKADNRFMENDEYLISFAAANIAQEMVRIRGIQAEIINFHDLTVGILLSYPSETRKMHVKEELFSLAEDLVRTISSLLKMQTTICIGRLTTEIKDIPDMLPFLQNAILYRDLKEQCQVLDLEEILPYTPQEVHYPFALEKELLQALRMGQCEQAMQRIEAIISELVVRSRKEKLLKEGVMQVLGSIMHTLLETGYQPHQLYEGDNLFEQLSQIREPEQIVRFFQQKIILPYAQKLSEDQTARAKPLIEQVTAMLKDQFAEGISLEACAHHFNTTPYTLSRLFKQVTGMNFIDYVTALRIEKAKELLSDSDMKVNEIAEQVGLQPSYFIRLFKRFEQITPGQYREKVMK